VIRRLFLLCAWASFALAGGAAGAAPKYILFLTADGFRTDYVEWYQPPHLTQLIAEGVRVREARNVFPTLTTPNMTSLVTGALPRTTGIAANTQYLQEADRLEKSPRGNAAATVAETLHQAGWATGAVNHFMLEHRGADRYVAAGYDDAEKTTTAILDLLRNRSTRFVGAIYGATDHAGHQHGPRSPEVKAAVLAIDAAVGRLVEGLKALGIFDETLIAFTADHGMSAFETKAVSASPHAALRAAGFRVATNAAELKPDTELVVIDAGVRLVYFRQITESRKAAARAVLGAIAGAEILERAHLDELGCHDNRSGDLIVSPLPGYTISGAGNKGGLHGRFSEQNPILFFRGPGFKSGVTIAAGRTIDVVPTLLHLVGVAPAATVDGQVLTEALR
jgi:predicted AlkP superfamily pyrophosphatase or phosphodiesterase